MIYRTRNAKLRNLTSPELPTREENKFESTLVPDGIRRI